MNFIAPRAEPIIREIPLSRLALAPENVRKTSPDPQADAALKASIAAFDLLENLVVRPDEPGEDGIERFAVIAGGRRLKAMQALVEDGVFDAGHPVACQVRTGDAEPGEISLAENVVRIAMHPADQVTAFAELVAAGQSVAAIAARFGASERIVEQRLRLGNAAPELLDAYREDRIDLEVLKAFAVNRDPDAFEAPDRLDIGRAHHPHLSLGRGIHHCLGASLARLQARIAFEMLLERFPRIELVGNRPKFQGGILLRGLESLPLRCARA